MGIQGCSCDNKSPTNKKGIALLRTTATRAVFVMCLTCAVECVYWSHLRILIVILGRNRPAMCPIRAAITTVYLDQVLTSRGELVCDKSGVCVSTKLDSRSYNSNTCTLDNSLVDSTDRKVDIVSSNESKVHIALV